MCILYHFFTRMSIPVGHLERWQFAEGMERVKRETDAWLETLGYTYDRAGGCYRPTAPNDFRVALFAHEGFGMAFLSALLDLPYPLIATQFSMHTSGMTVIDFTERDGIVIPNVLMLGGDGHLYAEHLPTHHRNGHRF